jgi:O-antigen/teichoic acid export membrane protein
MSDIINQVEIVKKSKSALLALSARSIIIYFLQVISKVVLAKNLLAEDFGVFGVLQGWIGCLFYFTDVGLGDILSRKSGQINDKDFASYFFIRLFLSVVVSVFFIAVYPLLKAHYNFHFDFSEYAFVISVFLILDVLSNCPMMLMGHKMEFAKIAKIELLGLLVTYIVQIAASYKIHGPWTFFIGIFFGKLSIVFLSSYFSEKIVFPKLEKNFLKINLRQGLLFQLSIILPSVQVIILPFLMSFHLNTQSIGLVFWIEGLVTIPLTLIFNYNRVAFISLSKFAGDVDRLKDVISRFLMVMCIGICFVFGLGAVLSKTIIISVFGLKWAEAVLYIHFSCIAFAFYCLRYLGLSILSAINKPNIRVYNEITIILLTATLLALLTKQFGIYGYFYATAASYTVCFFVMLYSIRNFLHRSVFRRMLSTISGMLISVSVILKMNSKNENIILILMAYSILFIVVSIIVDRSMYDEIKKYCRRMLTINSYKI